jgi:hypothetical protein
MALTIGPLKVGEAVRAGLAERRVWIVASAGNPQKSSEDVCQIQLR